MSEIAGKTVFVTGATGFLGGALVKRLAAEGARVKALVRRPNRDDYIKDTANIELVTGDILDLPRMGELIQGSDYVFHVAAALGGKLDKQLEINLGGTRNVALAASEAKVKRFVHVSSIAAYGFGVRGRVKEESPLNAKIAPYNFTKAEAERALLAVAQETGLTYSIIRSGMIFGPRGVAWTASLMRFAKIKPTPFFGDANGTAFPIYIDDVVDLMLILAIHPAAANEAFNCAIDPAPTICEFLGAYQKLAGHNSWFLLPTLLVNLLVPLADAYLSLIGEPQDLANLIPYLEAEVHYSMEKAQNLLYWQPKYSLQAGIEASIPYLKEEGLL